MGLLAENTRQLYAKFAENTRVFPAFSNFYFSVFRVFLFRQILKRADTGAPVRPYAVFHRPVPSFTTL